MDDRQASDDNNIDLSEEIITNPEFHAGDRVVITDGRHTTFFVTVVKSVSPKTGKIKVEDSNDLFNKYGKLIGSEKWSTNHLEHMTKEIQEKIDHKKLIRTFKYKDWDKTDMETLKRLYKALYEKQQ